MKYIDNFSRKHRKFGIENLMLHITVISGVLYLVDLLFLTDEMYYRMIYHLGLDWSMILRGQIWRIVTFLIIPNQSITYVFSLLCGYFVGRSLESYWGKCKFNIYIILSVVLLNITCLILNYGLYSGEDIYLSLLIVFCLIAPNSEFNLMFVLPLKGKHLSILYLILTGINIVKFLSIPMWAPVAVIIVSLIPAALFLSDDFGDSIKAYIRRKKYNKRIK